MFFPRKRRNRYTLDELALRREKRAEVVRSSLPLFAMVLLLCLLALLSLLCLKPLRELRDMEHERDLMKAKVDKARRDLERAEQEHFWMIKDPEYFEMISRDKNNLSLPDEKVIRIIDGNDKPLR